MLALSRKKNEAIIISNNVEITILEVKGDQVKVGITAPKDVPIYRKEVYTWWSCPRTPQPPWSWRCCSPASPPLREPAASALHFPVPGMSLRLK